MTQVWNSFQNILFVFPHLLVVFFFFYNVQTSFTLEKESCTYLRGLLFFNTVKKEGMKVIFFKNLVQ